MALADQWANPIFVAEGSTPRGRWVLEAFRPEGMKGVRPEAESGNARGFGGESPSLVLSEVMCGLHDKPTDTWGYVVIGQARAKVCELHYEADGGARVDAELYAIPGDEEWRALSSPKTIQEKERSWRWTSLARRSSANASGGVIRINFRSTTDLRTLGPDRKAIETDWPATWPRVSQPGQLAPRRVSSTCSPMRCRSGMSSSAPTASAGR